MFMSFMASQSSQSHLQLTLYFLNIRNFSVKKQLALILFQCIQNINVSENSSSWLCSYSQTYFNKPVDPSGNFFRFCSTIIR